MQSQEGSVLHRVAVFKTSGVALAGRARALNPNVAYKVNDRLSLAAGLRAMYLDFDHRKTPYDNDTIGALPPPYPPLPVIGSTSSGEVPQVTTGAMSSPLMVMTLSQCAPSSEKSVFHHISAASHAAPFGACGRPMT